MWPKRCPELWLVALCAAGLCACAPVPYQARPIDADASARAFGERSESAPGLAQFAAGAGYAGSWPPAQWRLDELSLAAIYFSPEVKVARGQAAVARAELNTAEQRPPFGVQPVVEHHSNGLEPSQPWSVGVALELPWTTAGRREARTERASRLDEAAQLDVAQAVWRARAKVRDSLIDLLEARRRLAALEERRAARAQMRALVLRRVELGAMSSRDLGQEDLALGEAEAGASFERARMRDAQSRLAQALALPQDTVERIAVADDPFASADAVTDPAQARALALRNRLDVRRRLLEFAAADADVKLAVASQYPELSLSPGYLWDQGDNVWILAANIILPTGPRAQALVREAQARRELAARVFEAQQATAIGESGQAFTRAQSARAVSEAAARKSELARAQLARVEKLFAAGGADRMDLTAARLSALAAQDTEREAAIARLRAIAALEDALQRPLLGALGPPSSVADSEGGR